MNRLACLLFVGFISIAAGAQVSTQDARTPAAGTYAGKLMHDALARHPNVVCLVIHANAPAAAGTDFIAGRRPQVCGQRSVAGPAGASSASQPFLVHQPLQDVAGATIGTLTVGLPSNSRAESAEREARDVQQELRRRVTNAGNLLEPYPYDQSVPSNTFAQALVDETMAAHPDLLILAIHASRPHEPVSIILGSNIGRIGKKDTEDDMQVLKTGKPYLEIKAPGDRYEDILVLHDRTGGVVGTVAVLQPFSAGADPVRAQRRAEAIRDEMSRRIPSLQALFQTSPAARPM